MNLEVFIDPCYYDMWCVKPEHQKNFNATLHFDTEKEALFAKQCIEIWLQAHKQEFIDEFNRQHELHKHRHNYFKVAANMVENNPRKGYGDKVSHYEI